MRKLRTAVIGAGFIGPAHVEAVRRLGFAEVVALAEVDAELAAKKAAQLGLARYTGNYEEVLKDPDIDVVHVCVPNDQHYPASRKALEAGKHVVCEKPLAMTSAQGKDLIRLAAEARRVGAVHFNNRGYPLTEHARALVQSGELGEVMIVNGVYLQDWLFFPTDYNWRLEPEQSGETRAVGDIGSHWLDLAAGTGGPLERCKEYLYFRELSDWQGIHSARIRGDSMRDTLKPGDIVVLRAMGESGLKLPSLASGAEKNPFARLRVDVPDDSIWVLSINAEEPTLKRVRYFVSGADWHLMIQADNPLEPGYPRVVTRHDEVTFWARVIGIAQEG